MDAKFKTLANGATGIFAGTKLVGKIERVADETIARHIPGTMLRHAESTTSARFEITLFPRHFAASPMVSAKFAPIRSLKSAKYAVAERLATLTLI